MIIDTNTLAHELCEIHDLCYTCPMYIDTINKCMINLCEKEYIKIEKLLDKEKQV